MSLRSNELVLEPPPAPRPRVLAQSQPVSHRWETGALGLILAFSAFLNLFDLGNEGWANTYYAAAVRSMLQSWHNFFFVSFDPGGFVSVDKPPLGFWIQTASAKLFGFHGWAILLPQALAGVTAVLVLFLLVRRAFGPVAGLIAAAVLAVTPVAVADNRNNTIDSLLVLTLLLAAWAVLRATERGRLGWLLVSMALVGVGFNIKMLEAYLALPALAAVYAFGAPVHWRTRILHLSVAAVVLLAISLSWAVAVDLTPPGQRPYVGSSQHNSELELAFGYNGIQRLIGMAFPGGPGRTPARPESGLPPTAPGHSALPVATPGSTGVGPAAGFPAPPGGGAPGFVQGGPSPLRLFDSQLGGQAGWLLLFALFGLVAAAVMTTPRRSGISLYCLLRAHLNDGQGQLVLWGTWLLVVAAFFSIAGFFHPYYLITLAPPVAALTGIGAVSLWWAARRRGRLAWLLPVALLAGAGAQVYLLHAYPDWSGRLVPVLLGLCLAGAAAAAAFRLRPQLPVRVLTAALGLGIAGLLLTPAVWSVLTVGQIGGGMPSGGPSVKGAFGMPPGTGAAPPNVSAGLPPPPAGSGALEGFAPPPGGPPPGFPGQMDIAARSRLLSYLQANRGTTRFMLAVPSAMDASSIVIQTGQPVMAMGGFTGSDPILTAQEVARDVKDGVVRFFLLSPGPNAALGLTGAGEPLGSAGAPPAGLPGPGFGQQSAADTWVTSHCAVLPAGQWQTASTSTAEAFGPGGAQQLYDCTTAATAS